MQFLVLSISLVLATEQNTELDAYAPILVKIEEDEYVKVKKTSCSKYIGVFYNESQGRWQAYRWSNNEKNKFYNGYYKDEETAARASDTLARKLMQNGEHYKLNFLDNGTEVYKEKTNKSSKYIGVIYNEERSRWKARRKNEKQMFYNGSYKDEETAAHASDTLARKLMENGEHYKLNFPDDDTEVNSKKTTTSEYIGVCYIEKNARWRASRRSKNENRMVSNGTYKDEETAAHASDTLARELMQNGEHHRLNFPDDVIEVYPEFRKHKRKRPDTLGVSQTDENFERL